MSIVTIEEHCDVVGWSRSTSEMEDSSEALRGNEKDVSPLVTKHQVIRRILANIAKQFPIQSPIHNLNLTEFRTLTSAYHWHHHSTHGPLNIYPGSKSFSPALFIEVIPSKAEMALVHPSKNSGWTIPIKLYQGPFSLPCYLGLSSYMRQCIFFSNKYKGFTWARKA